MKKLFIVTSYSPQWTPNNYDGDLPFAFNVNISQLDCSDKMELTHTINGDCASLLITTDNDDNDLFNRLQNDYMLRNSGMELPANHWGLEPLPKGYFLPTIPLIIFGQIVLFISPAGYHANT